MKKTIFLAMAVFFIFSFGIVKADTFFDDFNDGNADGWTAVLSLGDWRVENNMVTEYSSGGDYKFLLDNVNNEGQIIESKVLSNYFGGWSGVTFWYKDINNWVDVIIYPASSTLRVLEVIEGTPQTYKYPLITNTDTWYSLKVDANDSTGKLKIYLDDEYIITHTVATTHRVGLSGFTTGNAGGKFDDFKITDSIVPECGELISCGSACTDGDLTYGTVIGADSRCWMDRNLGATQVATAHNDSAAYGWIFQWGRDADGHQISTSEMTTTKSSTDTPGHPYFITDSYIIPYDWRNPQNPNLWQGVNGINNPCPAGFRLPTIEEWMTLVNSAGITDFITAYNSSLKLTTAGYRDHYTGMYELMGGEGYYWSSSDVRALYFNYNSAGIIQQFQSSGFSVRCIANNVPTVVELSSFDAIPGIKKVVITWQTESEIDNAGFNIWRTEAENGEYAKINDQLIPAEGSPIQGQSYEFVDRDVQKWKNYFYKLEDIDLNGKSTFHGPVKAVPRWFK